MARFENYNRCLSHSIFQVESTQNEEDVAQRLKDIQTKYPHLSTSDVLKKNVKAENKIIFMYTSLIETKIFHCDGEMQYCFKKTNNSLHTRPLPFANVFLECNFNIGKDMDVIGINILFGVTNPYFFVYIKNHFNLFLQEQFDLFVDDEYVIENELNRPFDSTPDFMPTWTQHNVKQIRQFICNFLDFLEHPDVELEEVARSERQNKKRIANGVTPIPTQVYVRATGKLKKYFDNIKNNTHKGFSHSFDVRGHYMHFWDKEHFCKIYKLKPDQLKEKGYQVDNNGLVSKWVMPYVKGQGIYVKKDYVVAK